jgi:hypothetical protein
LIVADLSERLRQYANAGSVDVCIRHLLVKDPMARRTPIEESLEAFVFMLADKKMGQNKAIKLTDMIKAARGQDSRKASGSQSRDVYEDDLTELFCSKTVAVAYKAAGLLAADRKAHMFVPKHFSTPCVADSAAAPPHRATAPRHIYHSPRHRTAPPYTRAHVCCPERTTRLPTRVCRR